MEKMFYVRFVNPLTGKRYQSALFNHQPTIKEIYSALEKIEDDVPTGELPGQRSDWKIAGVYEYDPEITHYVVYRHSQAGPIIYHYGELDDCRAFLAEKNIKGGNIQYFVASKSSRRACANWEA